MSLQGHVKNGVVVLDDGTALPDGTLVQVTPLPYEVGNPLAVIAAMEAAPISPPKILPNCSVPSRQASGQLLNSERVETAW